MGSDLSTPGEPGFSFRAIAPSPDQASKLSSILGGLADQSTVISAAETASQDRLVGARLGMANGLFAALRVKHPPTARHCLRVSLCCSAIAEAIGLEADVRDHLEIAALLHDIGKIGVPDHVLMKPGPLTRQEAELMDRHRAYGIHILSQFCQQHEILEIVRYANHRFDGSRTKSSDRMGPNLPLGSRVVCIADAYDAMTSDQVYRRAMSHEQAIAELFKNSPGQFDPRLVEQFAQVLPTLTTMVPTSSMAHRWLRELTGEANQMWDAVEVSSITETPDQPCRNVGSLFHQNLLDAMDDGVIFIDASGRIMMWNQGAERLTGISSSGAEDRAWLPSLLDMRDMEGNLFKEHSCPILNTIETGVQATHRVTIRPSSGSPEMAVNIRVIPVISSDHSCQGATLLVRDVSSEQNLEERVQNLHEKATTDPLTQIANRAEFDRELSETVEAHLASGQPCSLIICDIDHFKSVNDDFGHQAGDEALVAFARLLKQSGRQEDLVARYGGEEFVMLCPACNNADASRRAEQIRVNLEKISQPMLNGAHMTASFGVTELQDGDTPETMLRRADRALYQAKEDGRNQVVQLGSGLKTDENLKTKKWSLWKQARRPKQLLERTLVADGPMNVVGEKIRGFVADHYAEIVMVEGDRLSIEVDSRNLPQRRRGSDRHTPMVIELSLHEQRGEGEGVRTRVETSIRSKRSRDRRSTLDRARQLLSSLKSYLIAQEII